MPRKRRWQLTKSTVAASAIYHDYHQMNDEMLIEALFSKRFTFQNDERTWTLPSSVSMFSNNVWSDEQLITLKNDLNTVKDNLSDMDIVQWRCHTQNVNPAGRIASFIRKAIDPELCTQAWCKFYEILCSYPLVPGQSKHLEKNESVVSVHLCEAPGAFIAALNHYLALNHPDAKLSWLATTLNPYYEGNNLGETIPDDRLIYHSLHHWDFGPDNTGNIFSVLNRKSLIEKSKALDGPVLLVTADGSMDCQDDPSEQERTVFKLHIVEVATALQLLCVGGSFVLKMFTCFEHTSVCLLYLLNCSFKNVEICKPGTSKRGNSEVYVVCYGFKGSAGLVNHITAIDHYLECGKDMDRSMFARDVLPETFMSVMVSCCAYFKELQVDAICDNLKLFEIVQGSRQMQKIERIRSLVSKKFLVRFGVGAITDERRLVCKKKLSKRSSTHQTQRVGSHNERKKVASLHWQERLIELEKSIANESVCASASNFCLGGGVALKFNEDLIKVRRGRRFSRCLNSRFGNSFQMKIYQDLLSCAKEANLAEDPSISNNLDVSKIISLLCDEGVEVGDHTSSGVTDFQKVKTIVSEKIFFANLTPNFGKLDVFACDTEIQLDRFISLIKHISGRSSGKCVLVIDPPFTRVSVGVIHLLWRTFNNIEMWTMKINNTPIDIVTFEWTHSVCISWLQQLNDNVKKPDPASDEAIMEIVDLVYLLDRSFYEFIRSFLEKSLSLRTSHLIGCFKEIK